MVSFSESRRWSLIPFHSYKVNKIYSAEHLLIGQPSFREGDDIIQFDGVNKAYDQIRVIELIEL